MIKVGRFRNINLLFYYSILFAYSLSAQENKMEVITLDSVYKVEQKSAFVMTNRPVITLNSNQIKENGSQTLSESLSGIPGVSQITTGAISKPVIRGLSGNRIQINFAGLKLEDQQWEDEHGLGLSNVGVDKIELVKGPGSVLFGSEAMGGVINVQGENLYEEDVTRQDVNLKLFSNTYGLGLDYGVKKSGKNILLLRAGVESHGDYVDGQGQRVPNTRFVLYNLNLGYILRGSKLRSENRILASFNKFGFITDATNPYASNEKPFSRNFENAHHSVLFFLFSSVNSYQINQSTEWITTIGIQSNLRQEQERSKKVDLNLLLNTYSIKSLVRKSFGQGWSYINGMNAMYQTNQNYANRIIVPNALIGEVGIFSYLKKHHNLGQLNANFEVGLRYGFRKIQTLKTGSLNQPGSEILPFNCIYDNIDVSVGETVRYKNLVIKFDISSGNRSGNLAELSANGLHEGSPNWYVGNPNHELEKCFSSELSASWESGPLALRGSAYRNNFKNFIYLRPTDEEYFGFDVYRYDQSNALFSGFETGFTVKSSDRWSLSFDYSRLKASREDGSFLPFIPANKFMFDSKYLLPKFIPKCEKSFLSFGMNYTQKQIKIDQFEFTTPAYLILNAGAGIHFKKFQLLITCRNLTNKLYFDHLSRLKNFGVFDKGRNIVANIGWKF